MTNFAHHRLDAYRVALELFLGVERLAAGLPRGHRDLKDQMRRSVAAVVRHIAEGANRTHAADKATRFIVAKGECGECDATLEMAGLLGLAPSPVIDSLRHRADRIAAMLPGLARRERGRVLAVRLSGSDNPSFAR